MRCSVVRFVAFEDLGVWEAEIAAHGYEVEYLDVGVDDLGAALTADLAVVLGGPIDADDDARYPYLAEVRAMLAARAAQDSPTLGICLGAQLMAMALGGAVRRGTREVGWAPLDPPAGGAADSVWAGMVGAHVLHWHADEIVAPPEARVIASTASTRVQAFEAGRQLGFQCHPEADPEAIERWLIGHTSDLAAWGIDIDAVRAQARMHGDEAIAAGLPALRRWLVG